MCLFLLLQKRAAPKHVHGATARWQTYWFLRDNSPAKLKPHIRSPDAQGVFPLPFLVSREPCSRADRSAAPRLLGECCGARSAPSHLPATACSMLLKHLTKQSRPRESSCPAISALQRNPFRVSQDCSARNRSEPPLKNNVNMHGLDLALAQPEGGRRRQCWRHSKCKKAPPPDSSRRRIAPTFTQNGGWWKNSVATRLTTRTQPPTRNISGLTWTARMD